MNKVTYLVQFPVLCQSQRLALNRSSQSHNTKHKYINPEDRDKDHALPHDNALLIFYKEEGKIYPY